jgi:formylglycine-generating enzyme required for sulfatase activity
VAKALVPFFKPAQAVAAPPRTDATQSPSTGDTAHGLGGAMPILPAMPPPFPIPHAQPATAVAQPTMVAVEPAPPTTIQPTKRARSTTHHRPPWIAQAAGAGFLALLLGVIVIIRNQQGNVVARVESQEGTTVEVKKFETEPAGADAPPDNAKPDSPAGVPSSNPPRLAVAPFDAKQARAHQDAWAAHLGVPVEQTNSIGMKLMLIPPGEFLMGSPKTEIDRLVRAYNDAQFQRHFRSEGPQHSVKLTAPFCLSSCEVTQQQYQELMGVNRSHFSSKGAAKDQDTSRYPVEMVSWFDAIEFCNKLSEREHLRPQYVRDGTSVQLREGSGYRLPEEAEWEYACRAGTITPWFSGDDWRNLGKAAWFRRNSGLRTHPVGELVGNPFGLFDQYGNVWEWCWDRHGEYAAEAGSDPTNLPAGAQRVQRGGAWNDAYNWARSAFRGWGDPNSRGGNVGFRVARTIYSRVAEKGASP